MKDFFLGNDLSNLPFLDDSTAQSRLQKHRAEIKTDAQLFFSTWLGGVTKNLNLMFLPLDDHMAHRGDAVFEAARFFNKTPYLWQPHVERLHRSASRIGMQMPCSESELTRLVLRMIDMSGLSEGLLRIYISRGPGGFTVNPYECPKSQLYVVLSTLKTPGAELVAKGVSICTVEVPAKEGLMAQVKSCNYLINVLARKEALDRGFDFGVTLTSSGEVTESSTENLLLIDREGRVVFPSWENTLRGTTLQRLWDLLRTDSRHGGQYILTQRKYSESDISTAREMMLVGTTLGVLPVRSCNGRPLEPFTTSLKFRSIIQNDLEALKR